MNNIINPIFESIPESLIPAYGIYKNYQRDKKLELHDEEITYIKEILGLSTYELNDNELKIINVFLTQSEVEELNLDCIRFTLEQLIEKTNLNQELIQSTLLNLESEEFVKVKNGMYFKLDYSIFIKSDLISKIFLGAINYYLILNLTVDSLINIQNNNGYIQLNVDEFISEHNLNYFFVNPILLHLKYENIIGYDTLHIPTILLTNSFVITNQAKLLKFKKQLILKENL
ncbi:MAG: hypothetical protein WC279_05950 [Sulfurimonas sp.]|jgi:hypothetical protein|uniref:hypothetical protein n=1 Tax=Sulfurimonas sp. TaxID=2022749 RepID=UPI003568D894